MTGSTPTAYDTIYRGTCYGGRILVQRSHLDESKKTRWNKLKQVVYHSPTGFEWGYGGSGPADLALSLLVDVLEEKTTTGYKLQQLGIFQEPPLSWKLHMKFKKEVVSKFPRGATWQLRRSAILEWIEKQKESDHVEQD